MSIFHKLLLGFIGTSLVIIVIMSSVYYYYAEERVTEYVNSEIATGLKNAISFFASNYTNPIKSDLILLESAPSFDNLLTVPKEVASFVRFDIEKMFYRLATAKEGIYKEIAFFDAYGQEKIALKNKRRVRKFSSISQYGQGSPSDQGKALLFNRLTKSSPGTVLFEGPFNDSDNNKIVLAGISKREPEIAGFGGVIMLSCDLSNFITYLANVKVLDRKIAWLLTEHGDILLSPPHRKELVDPRPYLAKERHLRGDTTDIHFHESFMHCYGCLLDSSRQNSLIISFSVPHDIFSELMHSILLRGLIVISLVLCFSLLISYILAKQFVRPIIELSHASKRLSKGDFDVNINKDSGGEIGDLSRNFYRMAKELHQAIQIRDHEIINRKQAEQESLQAKIQWERSFNAITDIISIQDKDMNILRINKAGIDFFKLQPAKLVGRKCYDVFAKSPEPCAGCPEVKTIRDCNHHSQSIVHENLGKTFHVSSAPILDAENNLEYIVHVAKDITDQKRLEEELFQAHKMEAVGTLAGGIAHDFNNILSAILGYSELAKQDLPKDSRAGDDIDQVIKSSKRAADLVKQILTFSRKSNQHLEPVAPHLIIKEALKMLRSSLSTTINIVEDIDTECGEIMADPTSIHQIVVNLCTNSLHAMENEKGILSVSLQRKEISAEEITGEPDVSPGPFVVLEVNDTGQGMNQATTERIFDPYFTTKEVGKGTGLGLAVIHGIIQDYHGFIRVKSELGQGTTFYVHLPVLQQEISTKDETKTAELIPTGTERILVVDDESMIVNINKTVLERLGYKVSTTTESLDALEKIRTDPDQFDLIITDQTMPDLTGAELAQEILKITPNMPIILCTGYSSVFSKEVALAIGIKKYAKKPLDRTTLAKIVRQVLDDN